MLMKNISRNVEQAFVNAQLEPTKLHLSNALDAARI